MVYDDYGRRASTLKLLTVAGEHRIAWGRLIGYGLLIAVLVAMLTPGFLRA